MFYLFFFLFLFYFFFFFFQAEDGIRDHCVTGVQTCALPILRAGRGNNWVNGIVRLRTGVTVAQANARLSLISQRLAQQYHKSNAGASASVATLRRPSFHGLDDIHTTFSEMRGPLRQVLRMT